MNSFRSNNQSLKYERFTPPGGKNIEVKKIEILQSRNSITRLTRKNATFCQNFFLNILNCFRSKKKTKKKETIVDGDKEDQR